MTALTLKSNPRWWDWWKMPRMETTRFTIQDRAELKATRHKLEGKDWESIPRPVEPGLSRPHFRPKRYRLDVHRKKR